MIKRSNKNRGFTLIELILALAIGLIVSGAVISVSISILKSIRNERDLERLHSNAIYVVNGLSEVMRQSRSWTPADGNLHTSLTLTMLDRSTKAISTSNTAIFIDGARLTSSDVQVLYFGMYPLATSTRIGFTMRSADGQQTFSATTTVARRNSI